MGSLKSTVKTVALICLKKLGLSLTTEHGDGVNHTVDPSGGGIIPLKVHLEFHKENGNTPEYRQRRLVPFYTCICLPSTEVVLHTYCICESSDLCSKKECIPFTTFLHLNIHTSVDMLACFSLIQTTWLLLLFFMFISVSIARIANLF